ncbi:hypothetical protein SAICODRAFT_163203 [Saitoella complicata NRRL Y-17804]|nr:uncharacterized protein SAICODRAFT_163203 [Saitoella complicata NRRL Y-17804]ODQ50795.1 hypothetical protein SAICODRAFT_163203 [Saitoella complicata NRRL Y-17804]
MPPRRPSTQNGPQNALRKPSGAFYAKFKPFDEVPATYRCPYVEDAALRPFDTLKGFSKHLGSSHNLRVDNTGDGWLFFQEYVEELVVNGGDDNRARQDGRRRKLDEVLKYQQHERTTISKLPHPCIFCPRTLSDRAVFFSHTFDEHYFNIGLPDNLVYIDELLTMLRQKIQGNICICCEQPFRTRNELGEHLLSRNHARIDTKNSVYDKFYVINYAEKATGGGGGEEEDDDDWDDYPPDQEALDTLCLFCTEVLRDPLVCLEHMRGEHEFDLTRLRHEHGLDTYATIRLINYIRRSTAGKCCFVCRQEIEMPDELARHVRENRCGKKVPAKDDEIWQMMDLLTEQALENDPLLSGFEEGDDEEVDE